MAQGDNSRTDNEDNPQKELKFTWSSKADERGQKSDDYRIRIILMMVRQMEKVLFR